MADTINYNIYLDESRIDNPGDGSMVVGGIFVDRTKVRQIQKKIKEIKGEHNFHGEIKWVATDERKMAFLKALSSYLLELPSTELSFHCIVVQKEEINYDKYHDGDKELAFFKFIYELLKHRLKNNFSYYIFLDYKPTKVKERVSNLADFLKQHIYFNNKDTNIKHCQAYDSRENVFIQLADLFSGAVGYHFNNYPEGTKKDELAKFIASKVGHNRLYFSSPRGEDKFNIFKIILGN